MMETFFEKLLHEQIKLTHDMRVDYMTTNRLSHDDYMHSLGYLEALRRVEQLMDEIHARED